MRKRRNQIAFYIDEDDIKIISRIKEKTGMSFGEYMRNHCRDIPVKVFPKMDFVPYFDEFKDIGCPYRQQMIIFETKRRIKMNVSGHLRERNGTYYTVLNYVDKDGKRKTVSKSTGLPVRGNKKRAEDLLIKERFELLDKLNRSGVSIKSEESLQSFLKL